MKSKRSERTFKVFDSVDVVGTEIVVVDEGGGGGGSGTTGGGWREG